MRTLAVGIALLAAGPAFAGQAEDIAAKAAECWRLPSDIGKQKPAEFDVVLESDGYVTDATVLNLRPDNPRTKVFVLSAVYALQKCSPYPGASGTIRVVMDPAAVKGPTDPFKK